MNRIPFCLKKGFTRISIYKRKIGFDDRILNKSHFNATDTQFMNPKNNNLTVHEIKNFDQYYK
jgi:hypothetical protein